MAESHHLVQEIAGGNPILVNNLPFQNAGVTFKIRFMSP